MSHKSFKRVLVALTSLILVGCSETSSPDEAGLEINRVSDQRDGAGAMDLPSIKGKELDVRGPGEISADGRTPVDADVLWPVPDANASDPDLVDPGDSAPADTTTCPLLVKNAVVSVSEAEDCGQVTGLTKPNLALDSLSNPHVVADKDLPQVYIYHGINGAWTESLFAQASDYGTARIHLPRIEIDSQNRGWVSGWFGAKGMPGGKMGQGVWLVKDVTGAPATQYLTLANEGYKNGNLSLDPFEPDSCVVMTREGKWEKINASGQKAEGGKMWVGSSGEKIHFAIRPRPGQQGVWHAVMSGWSGHHSAYQSSVRHAAGLEPASWANKNTYPEMGEDVRHPSIGHDGANPEAAYIAIRYKPGLVINIFDGVNLLYPPKNLPVITTDTATHGNGSERFAPQWAPVQGGGAFLCWTGGDKQIRLKYFDLAGNSTEPVVVAGGKQCAMATDPAGDIHMVYIDGTLKYRKLTTDWACWTQSR